MNNLLHIVYKYNYAIALIIIIGLVNGSNDINTECNTEKEIIAQKSKSTVETDQAQKSDNSAHCSKTSNPSIDDKILFCFNGKERACVFKKADSTDIIQLETKKNWKYNFGLYM